MEFSQMICILILSSICLTISAVPFKLSDEQLKQVENQFPEEKTEEIFSDNTEKNSLDDHDVIVVKARTDGPEYIETGNTEEILEVSDNTGEISEDDDDEVVVKTGTDVPEHIESGKRRRIPKVTTNKHMKTRGKVTIVNLLKNSLEFTFGHVTKVFEVALSTVASDLEAIIPIRKKRALDYDVFIEIAKQATDILVYTLRNLGFMKE